MGRGSVPFKTLTAAMFDYELRLAEMDRDGVDLAVLSLSNPNVYFGGRGTSVRVARLLNSQMAEPQRRCPDRLCFLASLLWRHLQEAVAELGRARAGVAVGAVALSNVDGKSLTDPMFADIWHTVDEHELPVLVHPATSAAVEQMDMGRFCLLWSVGFAFGATLALVGQLPVKAQLGVKGGNADEIFAL